MTPSNGGIDPLVGATIELPSGEHALVLSIEGEYDDDTTLRYVTGDYAGSLTQRDTFAIRRYPVVKSAALPGEHWGLVIEEPGTGQQSVPDFSKKVS